jgi:hypothetical protein
MVEFQICRFYSLISWQYDDESWPAEDLEGDGRDLFGATIRIFA